MPFHFFSSRSFRAKLQHVKKYWKCNLLNLCKTWQGAIAYSIAIFFMFTYNKYNFLDKDHNIICLMTHL